MAVWSKELRFYTNYMRKIYDKIKSKFKLEIRLLSNSLISINYVKPNWLCSKVVHYIQCWVFFSFILFVSLFFNLHFEYTAKACDGLLRIICLLYCEMAYRQNEQIKSENIWYARNKNNKFILYIIHGRQKVYFMILNWRTMYISTTFLSCEIWYYHLILGLLATLDWKLSNVSILHRKQSKLVSYFFFYCVENFWKIWISISNIPKMVKFFNLNWWTVVFKQKKFLTHFIQLVCLKWDKQYFFRC